MKTRGKIQACFLGALVVVVVGCSTANTSSRAHGRRNDAALGTKSNGGIPSGCVRATVSEILAPVVPSFPVQKPKDIVADQGRRALVGTWTASYVSESKSGNLTRGYLHEGKSLSTFHRVDKYFDDGTYRVVLTASGKETVMTGEWEYDDGVFTAITKDAEGNRTRFSFKIMWHGKDEFESRIADMPGYEKILMRGSTMRSVRCRYDDNGLFHTEMIIGAGDQESAVVLAQGSIVYERVASEE